MQQTEPLKSLTPQPDSETTAWRILHDASAGIWVDHFDGHWLVQTESDRLPDFLIRLAQENARSLYWRLRDKSAATAPEWILGEKVVERFLVREQGASFWIDFSSGYSSGIFSTRG